MRAVGRQVEEERLAFTARFARPGHGFAEIDVGAIAFGLLGLAVAKENRVGVFVFRAGRITGLADAAATMNQGHVKALIDGPHRVPVAEVPVAKNAGVVAGGRELFGERYFGRIHHGASSKSVDGAGAVVVAAGHQTGPRRRADGTDVEARQDRAFFGHRVDVRRADDRIAMNAEIAIALIVGHDEDDVRSGSRLRIARSCYSEAVESEKK